MKLPSTSRANRHCTALLAASILVVIATALPLAAHAGATRSTALEELIAIHRSAQSGTESVRAPATAGTTVHANRPRSQERALQMATADAKAECPALLRHAFTPIQGGTAQSMCQYQGKVLLVVNTASQCGYTYQYEGLEALYRKYRERGLVVVGFPSNDFGGQEPGTNKEIAEFCRTTYGVQFPMFEKQSGEKLAANPFYAELVSKTGQSPRWNFHKYVIDRSGREVASFKSDVKPDSRELVGAIERLLATRTPANARSSGG